MILSRLCLAGHGNPQLVEKLATQGRIEMLELAVKVMDILAFETRWFSMISLACESLPRESLTELMHWLRLVSRDMYGLLKWGPKTHNYKYQCTKLNYYDYYRAGLCKHCLRSLLKHCKRNGLCVTYKTALVVDGLSIALHDAREED